jgi:RNA polymerase sigma factor (TIGR02999 family)
VTNPATTPPEKDVSGLLRAWSDGDRRALDQLTPIVYEELRRLAAHYMRQEHTGHSLQATALVNEAYLRLVDYKHMRWENRAHFFAVSAQLMRRILVDHARRHNLKPGRGVAHLSLDETAVVGGERPDDLVELDNALEVSGVTVMRDWSSAKAWLYREMSSETRDGSLAVEASRRIAAIGAGAALR